MSNQPNTSQTGTPPTRPLSFFRNSPLFPPLEQRRQPYAFYARMRRDQPVARDDERGLWAVYRYEDAKNILMDYRTFSSDFRKVTSTELPSSGRPMRDNSLIGADPPRHRQLRDLVSRAFTPRAVANLEPRIAQITDELLDPLIVSGQMDLVRDLSDPLPVIVIAEMLGIPTEERATFKRWSDDLIGESGEFGEKEDSAEQARREKAVDEMGRYFRQVIEERRQSPRDDLITGLVQAEIEGQRLTDDELVAFCTLLLIAGNVTTTNLLGSAVLCLIEHCDQFDRLRANPGLLTSAIEEVLRYEAPVQALTRVATMDVAIGGQTVPSGAMVIPFIGSANRDEAVFPNGESFDVARDPNPHLAFGLGIHFCLGAPLARLESRVALGIFLRRVEGVELRDSNAVEFTKGFLHGVTRLPIRVTPARLDRAA